MLDRHYMTLLFDAGLLTDFASGQVNRFSRRALLQEHGNTKILKLEHAPHPVKIAMVCDGRPHRIGVVNGTHPPGVIPLTPAIAFVDVVALAIALKPAAPARELIHAREIFLKPAVAPPIALGFFGARQRGKIIKLE